MPTSQELGLVNARNQFRAIVVKAGTNLAKIKVISESLPFHARYIIKEAEFERYVEPF